MVFYSKLSCNIYILKTYFIFILTRSNMYSENHTCFTDTAQIKEQTVEEHCAEDVSGTENRNCVPIRDKTASSVSLNIHGQPLIGGCIVLVSQIKEEEKQGYTETNKVFRLVH